MDRDDRGHGRAGVRTARVCATKGSSQTSHPLFRRAAYPRIDILAFAIWSSRVQDSVL